MPPRRHTEPHARARSVAQATAPVRDPRLARDPQPRGRRQQDPLYRLPRQLVADEVARREHKKFNLRIRRAGFRSSKTLEQFDFDFNPAIDRTLITDLATCRFVAEKVAVLIAGPCGTGKSHIAQALGHAAVRADYDVLFTTQSQLLASLNATRAINAYERRFQTFARVALLVIDDFGLKPLRAPQDEDLHDLVAERYEQGATIVTSNLDFSEWGDAFPQPTARRRNPRPGPTRRLPTDPGGRELSLSQAHARTPESNGCGFRSIPITDSGPFRSLIPAQTDHRFRSKLDSDSGWEPITFSVRTGTLQGS